MPSLEGAVPTSVAQFDGRCECGHCVEEHDCLSEEGECLNTRCDCSRYRARLPRAAAVVAPGDMYTSEPIPGRPSLFYAGDRYYANAEDARRVQQNLDEVAELEAQLSAAGDRAERLYRHRFALTPAGRAFVAEMRERYEATLRGRAALAAERQKEVAQ